MKEEQQPHQERQELQARFHSWKHNEVTELLFKKLRNEATEMTNGLIYDQYGNPELVKGRIQAVYAILGMTFEDIYDQ